MRKEHNQHLLNYYTWFSTVLHNIGILLISAVCLGGPL